VERTCSSLFFKTQELRKPYSILRDTRFAPPREKLKANKKGNKNNAAEPWVMGDMDSIKVEAAIFS